MSCTCAAAQGTYGASYASTESFCQQIGKTGRCGCCFCQSGKLDNIVRLLSLRRLLGSIGGPAAILAKNNIKKVELLEYPELGMEAIWKIEVEDFPAFILVDDKGNDFFAKIREGWACAGCGH